MISCSTNTRNTQTGKAYIQPHHTDRQGIHSAVRLNVCLGRQELLETKHGQTCEYLVLFNGTCNTWFAHEQSLDVKVDGKFLCIGLHTNVNDVKLVGKSQYAYR